jgi:FtsH-binding integral membrane protein
MNLDQLKNEWQSAGSSDKRPEELTKMTQLPPAWQRLKLKLIVEVAGLLVFLAVYRDFFDADQKPWWANALFLLGLVAFVFNDVIGYFSLFYPAKGKNLQAFTQNHTRKVKQLAHGSLIASGCFGVGVIVFFSSTVVFTPVKYGILLGMCFSLLGFMYWAYKNWQAKVAHFTKISQELG